MEEQEGRKVPKDTVDSKSEVGDGLGMEVEAMKTRCEVEALKDKNGLASM